MKRLARQFDAARPRFGLGGPLQRLKPVFDAAEHFVFQPATSTHTAPHVRDPLDVKRYMATVIVALIPCVLAGWYFFGARIWGMIAVSYVAGGAVEVLFACVRKKEINEGFLVTGLLFPLVLPPTTPMWMVAAGVAFGVTVGKEIFGGTGRNLFNPALVGRCFLHLAYPAAMTAGWTAPGAGWAGRLGRWVSAADVDVLTAATPLGEIATHPTGLGELFLGVYPGCMGATSTLAILIGGLFLLGTRVANWRIPAAMLAVFAATGGLINLAGAEPFGPVVRHLLAGGLLFGAFFMATDPVSGPSTNPSRWMVGALMGAATAAIRYLTPLPEGVMFAILLGNIVSPIVDEAVIGVRIRRFARET